MSIVKKAQDFEGWDISMEDELPADDNFTNDLEDSLDLVVEEPEKDQYELLFVLPNVPGGLDQADFEPEPEVTVSDDSEVVVESDPWSWDIKSFLDWLQRMMQGIPSHSGHDSTGLERAIAYLEALDREISKAVRMDLNNEIAIDAVEKARDEIRKGIKRLYDRHDKIMLSKYPKRTKNKKAFNDPDLVKEAGTTRIDGIAITVPLIISHVARTCVNSMVSAGKDIEDTFHKLSKKFKFSFREEAETIQLLADMGYVVRIDRGHELDEEVDSSSTDNNDWNPNYPA